MTREQTGQAIKAFRAENCPFCGKEKVHLNDAFCSACLDLLPPDLREKVSTIEHFLDSFHPAMAHLRRGHQSGRRQSRASEGFEAST